MRRKIKFLVGTKKQLLETVKKLKFALFGHVKRHDSISKAILRALLRVDGATVSRENGHHRVDVPAHARTAHVDLPQIRLEEDLC